MLFLSPAGAVPLFAANVISQFLPRHLVTVAPSLAEARKALAAGSFDLLLVDYDLDDGKGDTPASAVFAPTSATSQIGQGKVFFLKPVLRFAEAATHVLSSAPPPVVSGWKNEHLPWT